MAKKRRKMTPARRAALRKAQLASARKRKGKRSKDTLGHWVAKGVRRAASMATMGTSTAIAEFMDGVKADKRRKQMHREMMYRRRKKK